MTPEPACLHTHASLPSLVYSLVLLRYQMRRRAQGLQTQICRRVTTSSAGELWSRVSGQTAPWETLLTDPSSSQGRSVIRISGKESGKFIHGLVTNDIQRLPIPSEPAAAAFLTVKGRILADVMLYVPPDAQPGTGGPDKLYVDVARDLKEPLLRHLKIYKLRSKVVIADVTDSVSLRAVVGGELNGFKAGEGGVIAAGRDPRYEGLGVRVLARNDEQVRQSSGLRRSNIEEYTALRLAYGVPEGVDLIEKLPSECNLDLVNAVCFDKGCYLGQELTARTQFKGVVRKRLLPFILRAIPLEAPLPPAAPVAPFSSSVAPAEDEYELVMCPDVAPPAKDADVMDQATGKKVGTVSSVAAGVNVGLALLRLDNVLTRPVSLVVDSSPGHRHVIRPYLPPWWPTLDLKTGKPPA